MSDETSVSTPTHKAEDVLPLIERLPVKERQRLCDLLESRRSLTPGFAVLPCEVLELLEHDRTEMIKMQMKTAQLLCNNANNLVRRRKDIDKETREAIRLHEEKGLKWSAIAKRLKIKLETLQQRVRRHKQRTPYS